MEENRSPSRDDRRRGGKPATDQPRSVGCPNLDRLGPDVCSLVVESSASSSSAFIDRGGATNTQAPNSITARTRQAIAPSINPMPPTRKRTALALRQSATTVAGARRGVIDDHSGLVVRG